MSFVVEVKKRAPLHVTQDDVDHLPFLEQAAARVLIRRGDIVVDDASVIEVAN